MPYIFIFLLTLLLTQLFLPAVIRFSYKKNLFDYPNQRKLHKNPTPRLAGVALFASCIIAWVVALLNWPEIISGFDDFILWLSLGGTIIFAVGLWDDIRPLRFRYKILIESLIGLLLILSGIKVEILFIPFWQTVPLGWLSYPVTLIWFLGLLNSINLIDGLDGLAGGVSAIAAATMFMVGLHFEAFIVAGLMVGVLSACLGFLRFNLAPAKIFLGDSGSLFLGYLFAVSSLICPVKSYTALTLFVPLLALAVPILEGISTFLRRTLSLKKFYVPDNQHLYNLLLDFGFTQKTTVFTFYLISLVFSGLSLLLMLTRRDLILPIFSLFIILALATAVTTYILGVRVKTRDKRIAL